jgi:hypothetical protein
MMTDEMNATADLLNDVQSRMTRRSFAQSVVAAGVGLAAAGAITPFSRGVDAATITDVDILNFALNLEYLEAEFYTIVTTGLTIAQAGIGVTGTGAQGPTLGGAKIALSGGLLSLAKELAADEQAHVTLLRGALGAAAIAKPTIDFSIAGAFDDKSFLLISRILEDVGVTAYGGAAPLITDKAILGTAARILATEAEHTGAIRYYISQFGTMHPSPVDALDNVSRIISADPTTALTAVRTPSQVLAIVFQNTNAGASRGGLFPFGVNGTINAV